MKIAMISSTARDLPEHRKLVEHACKRMGFDPMIEDFMVASDAASIEASLAMVERCEVFIGIYAFRYGYIPAGSSLSITEMEFNRAKEKGIPRLVFLMHEEHEVRRSAIETGEAETKLNAFKERIGKEQIVRWFKSPEELQGEVFAALGKLVSDQAAATDENATPKLHRESLIPVAPEPYIAHPYSLLQTTQVVGRQQELNLLTDWITANKQVPASVRLFNIVAIGGMGKSALTWKWFNDIAPHELPNRAGWMWWSFYESDASFENFIIRALSYASGQTEKVVSELRATEREDQLWRLLDEQPFVLVLDGLERILLAYARMDAAQMPEDDLDERTANRVAHALGLPESAAQSFVGKHQLRVTADPRAGRFLRRLAHVRASRLLISTRLYPAELQIDTGDPLPGCFAYFLTGLTDEDALNLWREFKASGSREQLLPLFQSFGNYPLLLRALAGEVAGYRPAPRDFDKWRQAHPQFNPTGLPLRNAKTHVLEYALRGLAERERRVLHTIAAFRMPATWDTLQGLLVERPDGEDFQTPREPEKREKGGTTNRNAKPCADDQELDSALTELEDRGLLGWDKEANRYDLHPIARGVVWQTLSDNARRGIFEQMHGYFDAVPRVEWKDVKRLEDLEPYFQLSQSLIGLGRAEEAEQLLQEQVRRLVTLDEGDVK